MDIATLVGLLGGFGIIIGAIATGGDVMLFVNVPSILIVVGGTFMVTLPSSVGTSIVGPVASLLPAVWSKSSCFRSISRIFWM